VISPPPSALVILPVHLSELFVNPSLFTRSTYSTSIL
jgi:hypothetical protein